MIDRIGGLMRQRLGVGVVCLVLVGAIPARAQRGTTADAPKKDVSQSPPHRAKRNIEWFGLSVGLLTPGLATDNRPAPNLSTSDATPPGFALLLRGFTIGWRRFRWTILEAGGGLVAFIPPGGYYSIGTRLGCRFMLTERHQLEAGLGVGGGQYVGVGRDCESCSGFARYCLNLSPMFRYRYQTAGRLSLGASLHINFLIAPREEQASQVTDLWLAPTLTFDMGWST